jgi:hypothetical protein
MCICVLFLIVVLLPPGKNPFSVQLNNNKHLKVTTGCLLVTKPGDRRQNGLFDVTPCSLVHKFTDVSEESSACIFRVEKQMKQEASTFAAYGCFLVPMVDKFPPDYTASYPLRRRS